MVNHVDFDNPAVRQHMELYYTTCADVACGALDADQVPEWRKLVLMCGGSERRAKDVLIDTYLFRLADALGPFTPAPSPVSTGQMSLFT